MAEAKKEHRNIAQRLNAVMQAVDYIQKEKKTEMKYSIVSHDKVTELLRPHLVREGVVYYPIDLTINVEGNRTEAVFKVRFENIDDRDDFIDVATMGFGLDTQDKGPGKALSYGVKYALLKALGLSTGDDPDLDQTTEHRTTLDTRAETLEQSVLTSADTLALKTVMESAPTKEIMAALQSRNPGEFNRMRSLMSRKVKELRAAEDADQTGGEHPQD